MAILCCVYLIDTEISCHQIRVYVNAVTDACHESRIIVGYGTPHSFLMENPMALPVYHMSVITKGCDFKMRTFM